MKSLKKQLLSTASMVPLAFGLVAGAAVLGTSFLSEVPSARASSDNPCAAKKACNPCNPCAAKKACNPCNPCAAKKACNPCNPCAAKKACNPCNPCAAKKACNPCNPCAAGNPCNPCNPCAAGGNAGKVDCVVPRLKKAGACNPCAAKKACNPCNPCAAKKACNPCNPSCAAKKACNPCNPCAAKKACNPCNPCAAANACNPCNPCAAAPDVELTAAEMDALYKCLKPKLKKAYSSKGHWSADRWTNWKNFAKTGYRSDTHGGRFVQNYANKIAAKAYGRYEKTTKMPVGSTLVKPSFAVAGNGQASMGPLFIMEKMTSGWNKATSDWRYAMIMPGGNLFGITKGKNSGGLQFCVDCHVGGEDNDFMLFLPEELRK